MKLLSSLKEKKRYLVFEIIAEKRFSRSEIEEAVSQALLSFIGELGVSKAAPLFIRERFDPERQRFILKVNHQHVHEAKAALALIKSIKNTGLIIRSLTATGAIKKADKIIKEG